VGFRGGVEEVLRANLWLRSAMRVVVKLVEGPVENCHQLYELTREVEWEKWMAPGQTLAVEVAGQSRAFKNTAFAALVVKDGLVDRIRELREVRPDVDRSAPDVRIHLHLRDGRAGIGVDSSGEPLSHRGYRPRGGPAPLGECLAAGILLLAGFDGSSPFLDPMCGTGTLAIEAALLAAGVAPGIRRAFACERWWFLPKSTVTRVREEARKVRKTPTYPIKGSDADRRAVAASRANALAAGVGEWCHFELADVRALRGVEPGTTIVCNPPYGHRLGDTATLGELYRALGSALKQGAAGSRAWVLAGDRDLARALGLRSSRKLELFNGAIRCSLMEFHLGGDDHRKPRPTAAP